MHSINDGKNALSFLTKRSSGISWVQGRSLHSQEWHIYSRSIYH